MLGYNTAFAKATRASAFGKVKGDFIKDKISCDGSEENLQSCNIEPAEDCDGEYPESTTTIATTLNFCNLNCGEQDAAGVICYGSVIHHFLFYFCRHIFKVILLSETAPTLHLVGGSTEREGNVMYRNQPIW